MTLLPHISLKIGWLFLFAVLMAAGLLFTMVFFVCVALGLHRIHLAAKLKADVHLSSPSQIIMFSDLECDYINPIDLCNKLNQVLTQSGPF
jgi:protein cornichon